MATSSPVRIDQEIHASAAAVAPSMSRSTAQQISYWARIGRALDMSPNSSTRAIERVLNGDAEYDSLNFFEQAVFRSRRDERTRQRLQDLDLESAFAAEGRSYVELDGEGNVVERHPQPTP